jgi:hypothetical protein
LKYFSYNHQYLELDEKTLERWINDLGKEVSADCRKFLKDNPGGLVSSTFMNYDGKKYNVAYVLGAGSKKITENFVYAYKAHAKHWMPEYMEIIHFDTNEAIVYCFNDSGYYFLDPDEDMPIVIAKNHIELLSMFSKRKD